MILDSIVIDNFGTYGGHQEARLTPDPNKPIILFGGMNGGGKTTLLDAVQLAFYGSKARLSNRGRQLYRNYLRDSIHRNADPGEGANITLRFRRLIEGQTRVFELQRHWRLGVKGIEETFRVLLDGQPDDLLTEHWDEAIAGYLPNGIAHLFFFDGEQIKDLADGGHAAEIIGTAVNSLLGLDLLERLGTDLKVFERRKRAEAMDDTSLKHLTEAEAELMRIDQELERTSMAEGALVNEAGRLAKAVASSKEAFRVAGSELFQRRDELQAAHHALLQQKSEAEDALRELVAGPLPLVLVENLLVEVETQARHETEIQHALVLIDALEDRDQALLGSLQATNLGSNALHEIKRILTADRSERAGLAHEPIILDADDQLPAQIAHLRATQIPNAQRDAGILITRLTELEERLARAEAELELVPSEDHIAAAQEDLNKATKNHQAKLRELTHLRDRQALLLREREAAEAKLDRLGVQGLDTRIAEDDRQRMLKHSGRVRDTLKQLHTHIVARHTENIEALMLESFRKLLRKTDLVRDLKIDPITFEPSLTGADGRPLPFDRLSAGERQLLATSLLWGLARASGRPIPTIIDTPLGRLDSSHRRHLVESYFPAASHQVLLLSTDEEIVGPYHQALAPYVTRSYLLEHRTKEGYTEIQPGYFPSYEAAS